MPLFSEGQDPRDATQGRSLAFPTPPAPAPLPPTPEEKLSAVLEANPYVALGRWGLKASPDGAPVQGYDPIPDLVGTKYEPYIHQFMGDVNPAQTNARMLEIDHQERNQETLGQMGTMGSVAAFASGMADPFLWFGAPVAEATIGARMAESARIAERAADIAGGGLGAGRMMTGSEALASMGIMRRTALDMGLVGASTVPGEAIMQTVDPTHTFAQSAMNVASNALLAGVLGPAIHFLSSGELSRARNAMEASRRDWAAPPDAPPPHGTNLGERVELPAEAKAPAAAEFGPREEGGLFTPARDTINTTVRSANNEEKVVRWRLDPETGAVEATHIDGKPIGEPAEAPAPVPAAPGILQPVSVGAAAADARTMELEPMQALGLRNLVSLFGPEAQRFYDAATVKNGWISPLSRIFSKGSLAGRRALGDLVDTALHFTQERQGITPARGGLSGEVQARAIHDHYTGLSSGILTSQFSKYRGMKPGISARAMAYAQDVRGQAQGKLGYGGFKTEVAKALVDGGQHAVPEVAETAQLLKKHVFDPVGQFLNSVKDSNGKPILGDVIAPPKGDQGFLPRFYLKKAIAAEPQRFEQIVSSWLDGEQGKKIAAQRRLGGLNDRLSDVSEKMRSVEKRLGKAKGEEADRLTAELGRHEADHAEVRRAIEEEAANWEGKSSAEAKAALKARETYEIQRSQKMAAGLSQSRGERLTSADSAVDRFVKHVVEDWREMSPAEIRDRARQIRNRIDTDPEGRLPYDDPKGDPNGGLASSSDDFRGSLNARAFAIPSRDLGPFINTDLEHVIPAYLRNVIPDAILIDRFGDIRMTEALKKVDEEYGAKVAAAKDEKAAAKIEAQRKQEKADLAAVRDRFRGVYGMPTNEFNRNLGRAARAFGQYNAITMLGSSVLNRMQDVASGVSRYGMLGYMRDGFLPAMRGVTASMRGVDTADARMMGILKQVRIGVDTELGHIASSFGDVMDNHMPGNRFEKALTAASRGAMVVNLHGPWTDAWRRVSSMAAMFYHLDAAGKVAAGTATERDIRMLAYAGIDPHMAERIWSEFQAHHDVINGSQIPNLADWKPEVEQAFSNALRKEASLAVAMPGQEKPLWMSTPIGAAIGQFRSFEFAAWHRLMLSNLQMSDANALQGLLSMVAAGAFLSYPFYMVSSGRELSTNPGDWVREGITRSGILGPFSTMNTLAAKLTAGKADLFRAVGSTRAPTRRDQTNVFEDALGPTAKELMGLGMIIPRAFNGTLSAHDLNNVRQTFIPLQNLMFFRQLIDKAEDGLASHLGIKPMNRNPTAWPGIWQTPQ